MQFSNLKTKVIAGLLAVVCCATNYVNAESKLIVSEFPLTLGTNESAIIVSDHFVILRAEKDGITNVLNVADSASVHEPYIVTGPIKLIFSQSLLTYRLITNSPFKTMFLRCGEAGNIVLETNQTIRFFRNSQGGEQIHLQITQNGNTLPFFAVTEYGTEYDGPLNFSFSYTFEDGCGIIVPNNPTNCSSFSYIASSNILCRYFSIDGAGPSCIITNNGCFDYKFTKGFLFNYYIIDEFLSIPYNGYVENSPGSLILTVEKSTTLTNWFPAFITSTGDDQHTFYRLKMSRKDAGLTGGGGSFLFNGGGSMSYYENWEYPLPPLPPGLEYIE